MSVPVMRGALCGLVLGGLMLASPAGAEEVLWLSETAPPKVAIQHDAVMHAHMHHEVPAVPAVLPAGGGAGAKHDHSDQVSVEGESLGKDHQSGKQMWLRSGTTIRTAAAAPLLDADEHITMVDFEGKRSEFLASVSDKGVLGLKTELPKVGFYETYLERRQVSDGKLLVQLPKIELLWASCVAKDVDEESVAKPIINEQSPLELVRVHDKVEGCMPRLVSGDEVKFDVLSYGKPVGGVPVTLITQEGWRNTVVSDEKGHVTFTLIREYFPKWLEFKKYHIDSFLAVAEMERAETGELDGQTYDSSRYVASLPGKYRPSPNDYRSYAWGLGIALFVIVFGGLSIYLYRRRRVKPYREERVDDKA